MGGLLRHPPGGETLNGRGKKEGEGQENPVKSRVCGKSKKSPKKSIKCLDCIRKLWYSVTIPKKGVKGMETLKVTERRKGGRPGITEAQKDRIVQMYRNNMPISMIVSATGVSRSSVYKVLSERTEDDG